MSFSTVATEFVSLELYSVPIVSNPGVSSSASSIIWPTSIASDVPVIFPPGFSRSVTTPAATGSVTAENMIGISFVSPMATCAAGVVIATITSTLSATKP